MGRNGEGEKREKREKAEGKEVDVDVDVNGAREQFEKLMHRGKMEKD